jgi:arylsulfatase A-like enzyme
MRRRGIRGTARAAAALLAAWGLSSLAACANTSPDYQVVFDAVADRYQAAGDPSTANVPSAEIDGVRRTVLAASKATVLWDDVLNANVQAAGEITVEIPPPLRDAPLRIEVMRALFGVTLPAADARALFRVALADIIPDVEGTSAVHPTIVREAPRTILAPGPLERLTYRFPEGDPKHTALLLVMARRAQERSYTTRSLLVPPGARLRFGTGLDESPHAAAPPVRFTVTATVDGGERRLFDARLARGPNPAWQHGKDHDVSLDDYANREIRLRFDTKIESDDPGELAFPVWAEPRIVAPAAAARSRRRNLLLISLDTLRADHLGCYGWRRPTSPRIDARLANQGATFTRAYAAYPQTAGSHMTLFTSLEPCVHNVLGPTGGVLRPDAYTLAELLRAQGYATAAFTEDGWITAASGFARGFDTYVEETDAGLARGLAARTFARGQDWIRTHGDVSWFVFLHTYQTHAPYTPPAGYLERVAGEDPSDAARYDGEIRYTDDVLDELLISLDRLGVADDTVVVLISDHGEQFGEHGLTGHANSLYDELLHVPLIVRAPGLVPPGLRVTAPVGLIDVVPTLLELLELPPPRWTQGRSVVPLLRGGSLPATQLFAWWPPQSLVAIREPDGDKWIIDDARGRVQLFALPSDPHEKQPLAATVTADNWKMAHAQADARCTVPPPPEGAAAPVFGPRVRQKLRALGYVN